MPGQSGKSKFFSALGDKAKKSFSKHKADETKFSNTGRLPEGIENGIAKLVDIKIDKYKNGVDKGKDFFFASAVVVAPEKHNGVPIKGLRTSVMEPLCETPQRKSRPTYDDHVAWVLNMLRVLGIDTNSCDTPEELDAAVEALKEQGPMIRFRTWKGQSTPQFPNPRTNEDWQGLAEDVPDAADDAGGPVKDETEAGDDDEVPADDEEVAEEEEGDEIAELVRAAESDDETAQAKLEKMAVAAGFKKAVVTDAESWEAVADMIRSKQGGGEEAAEEEEWSPSVGDAVGYKPMDPKTKKPGKKAVDCEVVKVYTKLQTADVKNLETNSTYKSVKWDALIHSDE